MERRGNLEFPQAKSFKSVRYEKAGRIATITLNRPNRLNAIDLSLPSDLRKAVKIADLDDDVHVIILQGAGRAFCAGYDLKEFAEKCEFRRHKAFMLIIDIGVLLTRGLIDTSAVQPSGKKVVRGKDPTIDYRMMMANTEDFMSLWRCTKPTIAKIHGFAVAGGSDIALCCDLVIMAENAKIGYPPARIWGIPTTMQWINRLGPEKAKRMLFTGDLVTGKQAKDMGLILDCVPAEKLDETVLSLANRIAAVPRNQLHMSKMVVNSIVEQNGLRYAQQMATFFDGFARNAPEGQYFQKVAATKGFHAAVAERDGGKNIAEGESESSYFFEDFTDLLSKL